ncbi:MAG: DNA recombination protein RmuC [Bacilli bacterium]|nr:DNA recombination protein RmuC [Bacilli bacterium]
MEIALIIIASCCLVAIVIFGIILIRKKPDNNAPATIDLKEIGAISKQIEMLEKQIDQDIKQAVSDEIIKIGDKNAKDNEQANQKLERFQSNITDSLNKRFDAINLALENKINEMNKKVDEKMKEGFTSTSETMTQVRERLQAIDAAQKNIEALSQDVVSLKTVLQGNQTRGQYGEFQLNMVLNSVFGDTIGCYEEQYTIRKVKDGDDVRADAVVFMPEPNKMICIDSKFPFADYARMFEAETEEERNACAKEFAAAVKKHITVIKDKYIVDGKTAQQAIMFIPNDGVFAFIHHNLDDVVDYARKQNVIITSPSTLPAILITINMVRIEAERAKNAKVISEQLRKLGKEFIGFQKEWESLSTQIDRAAKSREKLDSRVGKITNKFDAIKSNDEIQEIEEGDYEQIEESDEF